MKQVKDDPETSPIVKGANLELKLNVAMVIALIVGLILIIIW